MSSPAQRPGAATCRNAADNARHTSDWTHVRGYAVPRTVPRADRYDGPTKHGTLAKPGTLNFAQAANLLLSGTTAAELLETAAVSKNDTVLLHGAAGAVGLSVLQQARLIDVRVIGTADTDNFGIVESFGAVPVPYAGGPDALAARVRGAAPDATAAGHFCSLWPAWLSQ